ncbi:hypothetical protein WDW37_08760 [Bdellovibrionota bacterium FG-1]
MRLIFGIGALGVLVLSSSAWSAVFNYPRFVTPGDFAIGLETDLTLTSGAGLGIEGRYTQGLNDLTNLSAIIGTGSGPRQFRVGAAGTFDFFPDIDKQPGIGLALQGIYIRIPTVGREDGSTETSGQVELSAIPYIHKSFVTGTGGEAEPFVAVPIGMGFANGQYRWLSSVVVGAGFKTSEKIRTSIEFGIAVNHTESYLSAGVTYYH